VGTAVLAGGTLGQTFSNQAQFNFPILRSALAAAVC
jgi:hypothetical protein